eukprot:CAMPEP_0181442480 /NCGR_PEP_ID=MMETSP1110-20121109/24050_1 /TAXON_ID=174948 /ORGANISM="Symbiodinium sp., Strain CCMP421" /LENGTH=486 /DNA_ID=CAMNT_0023566407 /DNA_START=56 /DNA_END=1513 /DNA_ORIENTATION=+
MAIERALSTALNSVTSSESSNTKHKIGAVALCCNVILSITGTAVLGVSAQMKTFGWILTPVTLVLGMLLTSEMVHLVGVTSEALELRTGEEIQSYQDFAEASLGRPGWWLSAISSTLSLFGMIFGGLILESGNMQITSPITWHWPLGGDPSDGGRKWWAVLLTSTTLFYSYVDIGHLLHNSAWIGVGLTLFCLVCVYAGTFAQFKNLDDFNSDCATTWNQPYRSVGVNVGGEEPAFESFLSLFSVFSYVMYAFAIVVTLPTLRSTMQDRSQLTPMCIIAFTVVSMEFLVIMFAYYWVFGNLGPENIIDGMRNGRDELLPGWWATVDPWGVGHPSWLGQALGWGITLHLLCSDAIYVPVTVVSVEALLPKHIAAKRRVRFAVRLFVSLLRLLVAALIKDFVKMTNLTSAACVTMNNLILPIFAFHIAGPAVNAGPVRRVVHIFILALGAFSMVFGTIGAIHDLWASRGAPTTGSFPRPGISTQCFDA